MRFLSVMYGLMCLPVLLLAILTAPLWVPLMMVLAWIVPGLATFKRTSGKRSWNIASFHSPHSLTWRWLVNVSLGGMFARPRLYMSPGVDRYFGTKNPFVTFAFNIGIAGASASTNNYGWQFAAWLLGIHVHFSQQAPMWYRDLYVRARDEADQLAAVQ